GISVDPVDNHKKWAVDIKEVVGFAPNYPMIGDPELKISKAYGMLPAATGGTSEGRTPADNQTVRNVFIIGPDKKIKLILVYPMTTGRNFDEVVRVLDSMQLTAKHQVATPANWKQGEDVIIAGSVSHEEAKTKEPEGHKHEKAARKTSTAVPAHGRAAEVALRERPSATRRQRLSRAHRPGRVGRAQRRRPGGAGQRRLQGGLELAVAPGGRVLGRVVDLDVGVGAVVLDVEADVAEPEREL